MHYICLGAYLWTLKDKIDRDWMRGYQQLPTMEEMAAMMAAKAQQVKQRVGTAGVLSRPE
jgi:hypothetical protein